MENRHRNFLISLVPTLLMLGLQLAAIIFLSEIHMVTVTANFSGSSFSEYMDALISGLAETDFTVNASLLYSILAFSIFVIWYVSLRREESNVKEAFSGCKWTLAPGILVFIVGLQYVCNYLLEFLGKMFPEWLAMYEQIMKSSGLEDAPITVPIVLYAVILGPVSEELAFRGITYGYARRALPLWAANAIQAVLFAGLHMNPLQSAYALLFGALVGYIYAKSRNIVLTSIIHILFNLLSFIEGDLFYMGDSPIAFFAILLTSLMATYFGFILIIRSLPVVLKVDPKEEYRPGE